MAEDTTKATRSFLNNLFADVTTAGWGLNFANALSDDLKWTATGSCPLSRTYNSKSDYLEHCLRPIQARMETSLTPIIEKLLVDGEWGVLHFRTENQKGKNGVDYSMSYCWIMRVAEGKIVEVTGFFDSNKVSHLFAS